MELLNKKQPSPRYRLGRFSKTQKHICHKFSKDIHVHRGLNMTSISVCKQQNLILNSVEIERAISFLQISKGSEKNLLQKIISLTTLKSTGRDILSTVCIANGSLAKALGYSAETIGRLKESLHAKGIIEVDGKNWQDYRYADGNRFRAKWIHRVNLTEAFASAFYQAAKTRTKIQFDGMPHPEYMEKVKARRERNLAAVLKSRMLWVVNNLLDSCESISVSSVCEKIKNISMKSVVELKGSYLNTQNKTVNPATVLNEVNKNLTNAVEHGKRAYKQWTESVKKICVTLIDSGKTYQEVANIMVKQSYCKNFDHFTQLMQSTPMLC